MTPDLPQDPAELFEAALDLDPSERAQFLRKACAENTALRAEVESLLAVDKEAAQFLKSPLRDVASQHAPPQSTASPIGKQIGGFRILGIIGAGGMGTVFEAEQDHPRRAVALKIVRGGQLVDEHNIKLFQREIQTLARLKHPNIAAIYEADRTEDGQHFFAMELVRGASLLDHAREKKLDVPERLQLFCRVCDAINYAHQRGVIHRDLKPSNILVDAGANPKVLDFGLAKITDSDVTATTLVTEIGKIQGTLSYMSPEQARGDPTEIDLRTDVYSLGIILYELLTGERPYDVTSTTVHEAVRVICEEAPRRLSTIRRTLRGDLETIVLKALEKDPDRRYQSASALAQDVDRYLKNEPISARPPSAVYQLKKLIARHKAPFGFLAMLFVVVVAFGAWMTVLYGRADRLRASAEEERAAAVAARDAEEEQRRTAEANFLQSEESEREARTEARKAEQVSTFLQDILSSVSPEKARGRDVTILRELLEDAARRVEGELSDQPEVEAAVRDTIGRTYLKLGLYDEAEPHLRAALALREAYHGMEHPDVGASLNNLAALLVNKGDHAPAEPLHRRALEVYRNTLGPENPQVAASLYYLAVLLKTKGQYDEAEETYEQALAMMRKLYAPDHPDIIHAQSSLATLRQIQGDFASAEALYRDALAASRSSLGNDHPNVSDILSKLALVLKRQGKYAAAEPLFREALAVNRRVLGDDHPDVADTLNRFGSLLKAKGDYQEAEALYREALAIHRRALGNKHPNVVNILNNLGVLLKKKGRLEEAEPLYREALSVAERVYDENHPIVATCTLNLASLLGSLGDHASAESLCRRSLAIRRQAYGNDHPKVANNLNVLATLLKNQGSYAEAEALYEEALGIYRRLPGKEPANEATCMSNLATMLAATGRYREAKQMLLNVLGIRAEALGAQSRSVAGTKRHLAEVLLALGEHDKAEQHCREAIRVFRGDASADQTPLADALYVQASILIEQGDAPLAEQTLRECLQIRGDALPPRHEQIAIAESALGGCLTALGHYPEAEALLVPSYSLIKTKLGETRPPTLEALQRIVVLYDRWGKPDQAEEYRRQLQSGVAPRNQSPE